MYTPSFANRSPAFYGALLSVTLLPLYLASYQYRLWHPYGGKDTSAALPPDPVHFVADWVDVDLVQPFNPSAIASYCNRVDWHPNLVFTLSADDQPTSIDALHGRVLDFVFYAIEAGASIVLPSFGPNGSLIPHDQMAFGMLFDAVWLISAMEQACPQMKIYEPGEHRHLATALPGTYMAKGRRMDMDPSDTKQAYLEDLDSWLKSKPEFKPDGLTLVNVGTVQWPVDTRSLPPDFRRNFGRLLRTSQDLTRFAASTVQEVATRYHTAIDPKIAIPKQAFYSAHLATMSTPTSEPYSNISAQVEAHIDRAIEHNLRVIYVASDNTTELAMLKIAAAKHALPIIAVSKYDLLSTEDVAALKQLTPTQQALVDAEVLKRSSMFGGAVSSSSSYSIALTRNQWLVDQGKVQDPWFVVHQDTGVTFDDGLSRILGRDRESERRIPRGTWP